MMITDRRNVDDRDVDKTAESQYIGFATNRPKTEISEYDRRWGIETGYSIEHHSVRTRMTDLGARMPYFTTRCCCSTSG